MARLRNLARMTTATTGTGTITLGSAVNSFLTFANAGVADGETVSYGISDGSQSEVGRGVYTSSGTTLTRNVLRSTNSNSPISLSGNAHVYITVCAEDLQRHGQGRLVKSGSNLLFKPFKGNGFVINDRAEVIPSAGVSLAFPTAPTVTISLANPAVVSWTAHGLVAGTPVIFKTTGALPASIVSGTTYYVSATGLGTNSFQLTTLDGTSISTASQSQSGTHRIGFLRNIYSYMNSGVMTLEASQVAATIDSVTGIEIKTGDVTRTRVGMALDDSDGWVRTNKQKFVRSRFNESEITLLVPYVGAFTGSATAATWVIADNGNFPEWLSWEDDVVDIQYNMNMGSSTMNLNGYYMTPLIDNESTAASLEPAGDSSHVFLNAYLPTNARRIKEGITEGHHFSRSWVYAFNGGTNSINWAVFSTSNLNTCCGFQGKISSQ